jgi:hypothetical protein
MRVAGMRVSIVRMRFRFCAGKPSGLSPGSVALVWQGVHSSLMGAKRYRLPQPRIAITCCIFFAAASLWFRAAVPIYAIGGASYDDLLFVRLAASLLDGRWLGDYNNLTLAKGMGYPAFIAVAHLAGLPLKFAEHLLYLVAAATAAWLVARLTRNYVVAALLFVALALNPMVWTNEFARVARQGFYTSLSLLVLTLAAALLFHLKPRITYAYVALLVALGVMAGVFWLTREEGLWLVPALAFLLAAAGVATWRANALPRGLRETAAAIAVAAIPVASFVLVLSGIAITNHHYYGILTLNEVEATPFRAAYGALARIEHAEWRRYVPVPAKAREKAYAASEAARELRPSLEGPIGAIWTRMDCIDGGRSPCGEVPAASFLWALRDSVAAAGHYSSASDAAAFYERLATEINRACDDGKLACLPPRTGLAPPFRWEYLFDALSGVPRLVHLLLQSGDGRINTSTGVGPRESLRFFASIVGPLEPLRVAGEGNWTLRVMRGIAALYNAAMPVLAAFACLGVFLAIFFRRAVAQRAGVVALAGAAAIAVLARVLLLTYIDASSFAAADLGYGAPAIPFLCIFVVLGLYMGAFVLRGFVHAAADARHPLRARGDISNMESIAMNRIEEFSLVIRRDREGVVACVPETGLLAKGDTILSAVDSLEKKLKSGMADYEAPTATAPRTDPVGATARGDLGNFTAKSAIVVGIIALAVFVLAQMLAFRFEQIADRVAANIESVRADLRGGGGFWSRIENGIEDMADPRHDLPPEKKQKILSEIRTIAEKWRPFIAEARGIFSDEQKHGAPAGPDGGKPK